MRSRHAVLLAALLLVVACGNDPLPPPDAPPSSARAGEDPDVPPPLDDPAPSVTTPDASASASTPEPVEWKGLEETLREEPVSKDLVVQKDLDATKTFVSYESVPLVKVVKRLSEETGVSITVLTKVFEERAESELRVTLEAGSTSAKEALDLVCANVHLVHWIEGGGVKIAPFRPLGEMTEIVIPVGRLTELGYEGDALADMVRESVDFEVWDANMVRFIEERNALSVKAPKSTHRKVLSLLRKLFEEKR